MWRLCVPAARALTGRQAAIRVHACASAHGVAWRSVLPSSVRGASTSVLLPAATSVSDDVRNCSPWSGAPAAPGYLSHVVLPSIARATTRSFSVQADGAQMEAMRKEGEEMTRVMQEALDKVSRYESAVNQWLSDVATRHRKAQQQMAEMLSQGEKTMPEEDPVDMSDPKQRATADKVLKAIRTAVALRKKHLGGSDPGMVSAMLLLASVLKARGDIRPCIATLQEALDLTEQIAQLLTPYLTDDNELKPGVKEFMHKHATMIAQAEGNDAERQKVLDEIASGRAPPAWLELVVSRKYHNLSVQVLIVEMIGECCRHTEDDKLADQIFAAVLSKAEARCVNTDPKEWTLRQFENMEAHATLLLNYARYLASADRTEEARMMITSALEALQRVCGSPHAMKSRAVASAEGAADIMQKAEVKRAKREQLIMQGLDPGEFEHRKGEEEEEVEETPAEALFMGISECYVSLATMLMEKGEVDEARALMKDALQMSVELWGQRHINVAHSLDALGSFHGSIGEMEQADKCFSTALSIFDEVDKSGMSSLQVRERLVEVKTHQNNPKGVIEQLEAALETKIPLFERGMVGADEILSTHLQIADACMRDEQPERAKENMAHAVSLARDIPGMEGSIVTAHANLLLQTGDYDACDRLLDREIDLLRSRQYASDDEDEEQKHADEVQLGEYYFCKGTLKVSQKQYEDALEHYMRSKEVLSLQLNPHEDPHHFGALNIATGHAYGMMDRFDEGSPLVDSGVRQMQLFAELQMERLPSFSEENAEAQIDIMRECMSAIERAIEFYERMVKARGNSDPAAKMKLQNLTDLLRTLQDGAREDYAEAEQSGNLLRPSDDEVRDARIEDLDGELSEGEYGSDEYDSDADESDSDGEYGSDEYDSDEYESGSDSGAEFDYDGELEELEQRLDDITEGMEDVPSAEVVDSSKPSRSS